MNPFKFISYKDNNNIPSPEITKVIDKKYVHLKYGDWKNHKMAKVCPLIKEWKVVNLHMGLNNYPPIIKEISSMTLPYLQEISLSINQIESLEGLSRVGMLQLKRLYLNENFIVKLNQLKKCYWPHFVGMDIRKNKIKQFTFLHFLPEIQNLLMEFRSFEKFQIQDIRVFAKLKANIETSQIYIKSKHCQHFEALKKKFNKIMKY